MTVVDDDFAYFAYSVLVDHIIGGVVAAVPGRLVVYEDWDFSFARGSFDGAAIFDAHGQRFLHHYRDGVFRGDLYSSPMVKGVGVYQDCLRVCCRKRFIEVCMPKICCQGEFCRVAIEDFAVRLDDADDLNIVTVFDVGEESVGMPVREARHGDTKRRC